MINLLLAQRYLYEQLETALTLDLPEGTLIWAHPNQIYGDGPGHFDLNPSSGSIQTSAEVITKISLPSVDLDTLIEAMDEFFIQTYGYRKLSLPELALLMRVSGYAGYHHGHQIVIFDLSKVRINNSLSQSIIPMNDPLIEILE